MRVTSDPILRTAGPPAHTHVPGRVGRVHRPQMVGEARVGGGVRELVAERAALRGGVRGHGDGNGGVVCSCSRCLSTRYEERGVEKKDNPVRVLVVGSSGIKRHLGGSAPRSWICICQPRLNAGRRLASAIWHEMRGDGGPGRWVRHVDGDISLGEVVIVVKSAISRPCQVCMLRLEN